MPPATHGPAFKPTSRFGVAAWAVVAAFGTYFCMYAFRKPFTAAGYKDAGWWGAELKTVLVSAQVLGYMLSKFVGIRVVAELPPHRRAVGILMLILAAELALVLFGLVPAPWNAACLFLNGLPLGMVFGLVLGYLEGRRETEALTAGLCASFILAGGVTKDVGKWLLEDVGVTEAWMPAAAGGLFLLPLLAFTALLSRVPPPTAADQTARAPRPPIDAATRRALAGRYLAGLALVVVVFTAVTILRSIRDDFAPELFRGLGEPPKLGAFARADLWVALGVMAVSGCGILVRDNRTAFLGSLTVCAAGCILLAVAAVGVRSGWLGAFGFMVACGLGLYIPYVTIHTTVFERLLATTRDVGNLGFLMYLADAFGYLGYVAVLLGKRWLTEGGDAPLAEFFVTICLGGAVLSALLLAWAGWYFAHKLPRSAATPVPESAHV